MEEIEALRAAGKYVPRARLNAAREAEAGEKGVRGTGQGAEHGGAALGTDAGRQHQHWDDLARQIQGLVNKVSVENIQEVIVDLFRVNLIRGKGLFCDRVLRAAADGHHVQVYASVVAVLNSKIPEIGELLIARLVLRFRRAFREKDRGALKTAAAFIAALCNQAVAHEILILQVVHLLLSQEGPADETSIDVCIDFMTLCGAYLDEVNRRAVATVFEKLRQVAQEGEISGALQTKLEKLMQLRRQNFASVPKLQEDLDLVEEDDQIMHMVTLDDDSLQYHGELDTFQYDPDYAEHEAAYEEIRREILGDDDDEDDAEEEESGQVAKAASTQIQDMTATRLANFQKTVYLTMMSSMNSDEAVHKLLKLDLVNRGMDDKLIDMVVRSCSQEKTYSKYYGQIGEKLASLNRRWDTAFQTQFESYYQNCEALETNQLRNVAKFWGHLFASDKMGWECLSAVELGEETTTAASRIFIKFMFQEMVEEAGVHHLKERLAEPYIQQYIEGLFPVNKTDDLETLRFSINFFTAIGLGVLTETMREALMEADARGRTTETGHDGDAVRSRDSSYSRSPSPRGRRRRRSLSPVTSPRPADARESRY